jgi:signal transduction histidine kinase
MRERIGRALGPSPVRYVALAAGLSVVLLVELALSPPGSVGPGQVAWGLATTVPLAAAGRWPVAAGLTVQALYALGARAVVQPDLLSQGLSAYFVATYVVATGARSWGRAVGWGSVSLLILALQGDWDRRYADDLGAVIANVVFGSMALAVAAVVRVHAARSAASTERAEAAVRDSEAQAQAAVQAERDRLSVELHDLVAHSLSVTLLRARGARHEEDLEEVRVALRDIEQLAGNALSDMRRLLEIVHGDHQVADLAPQPGLDDVPELVRRLNAAGVQTSLRVEGSPQPVSSALGLSAYRVVQESLTNVLRHANRSSAEVLLRWSSDRLDVAVADGGPAEPHPGTGQGLRGLQQRVALFGGRLEAGPREGGGFEVAASLPFTSQEHS